MKKQKDSSKKEISVVPLSDRVLVLEIKETDEKVTSGGIIIPDTADKGGGSKKGKVLAVGEGRWEEGKLVPTPVKVGDTILFQWGDALKIDEEEYQIVNASNILAILK
ncbi:MAG: co-chaperone GroES [bacterium]|nr:co-chaperone GroES [bacterium]